MWVLQVLELLRNATLKIIPMENVNGRAKVEGGALCERKNGRVVDTNRYWEVDWGKKERDYDPYEEYPGIFLAFQAWFVEYHCLAASR